MPSVYTNSVAKAYLLPFRGLEGAGEGGRSCPSRSMFEKALPRDFAFWGELGGTFAPELLGPEPDILREMLCVNRPFVAQF